MSPSGRVGALSRLRPHRHQRDRAKSAARYFTHPEMRAEMAERVAAISAAMDKAAAR